MKLFLSALAIALLATVVGGAAVHDRTLAAAPGATTAPLPCPGFVKDPVLGSACPADGGWRLLLTDGSSVFTHGADPLPSHVAGVANTPEEVFAATGIPPERRTAACVEETVPHGELFYVRPLDGLLTPLSVGANNHVLLHFEAAAAILAAESHVSHLTRPHTSVGWVQDASLEQQYAMSCGSTGTPGVRAAFTETPKAQATFSSIISDLKAWGLNDPNTKYWVWYDGPVACDCAGFGTIMNDDQPGQANLNNAGPSYGVTLVGNGPDVVAEAFKVMMHENGHNLGAVQNRAPHSSGAWHCNDGQDIMCYGDGGPASQYTPLACLGWPRFDCNHDDYYTTRYGPNGFYPLTQWDVANSKWLSWSSV